MTVEVDQLYFEWLVNQVGDGEGYEPLLHMLYEKEYIFIVANDDNRAEDTKDLRVEFMTIVDAPMVSRPISVLEVLVALSRRLEFLTIDQPAIGWAFRLLENLELHKMKGKLDQAQVSYVDEVLERLLWRNYEPDGTGGFFPLAWPAEDQRRVEIWYQMSAYLEEQVHP